MDSQDVEMTSPVSSTQPMEIERPVDMRTDYQNMLPISDPRQMGQEYFDQYVRQMQEKMFKKGGGSNKAFAKPQDFRGLEVSRQARDSLLYHQFQRKNDYFHDLAFTRAINLGNNGTTVGSGGSGSTGNVIGA